MKCMYDMNYIFSYNDNLLSLEEMKKFEEHLNSCEECRSNMSKDKIIIDSFREEESCERISCQKEKLMAGIPFGKYGKKSLYYRVLSSVNSVIPGKAVLVKVVAAVIMLALVWNNQTIISNIANKVDITLTPGDGDVADNPDIPQVDRQILTNGELSSDSIVSKDSTNIMLVGEETGAYDLICVVNIDKKAKHLKVIIVPEYMEVDYSSYVKNKLSYNTSDASIVNSRIKDANAIASQIGYSGKFQSASISFLADVIKEKFGIAVDQYFKFDFKDLSDIVDLFGGVEIDVPYKMEYIDISQNISIHLDKGRQHLDGKMAKFFLTFRINSGRYGVDQDYDTRNSSNKAIFMENFLKQKVEASDKDKLFKLFSELDKKMEHSLDVKNEQDVYNNYLEDIISENYSIDTLIVEEG